MRGWLAESKPLLDYQRREVFLTHLCSSLLCPCDPVAVVVVLALALVSALGSGELLCLPLVLSRLPGMGQVLKLRFRMRI